MSEPAPVDVKLLDEVPGAFWLGAWRSVNALIWLKSASLEIVQRIDRAIGARFDVIEERMSTVHVIVADAGPPEHEARAALVEMNSRLAATVACGAVVIERGGLMGIAVRSAVTGLIIAAPKHYRVKVFDGLEACAPWVAEQHDKATSLHFDADSILEFLKYARQAAK